MDERIEKSIRILKKHGAKEDIIPNRKDMHNIGDITELSSIRNPSYGKGDRKFMKLLPSFNGEERRKEEEIPTSRDYLITGVKRFAMLGPNFFLFLRVVAYYGPKRDKIINRKDFAFVKGGQYGY